MLSKPTHRAWRLRRRKAQVSAVATILGLLLVVTFIANYISTTLPNQMAVNDLNHEILVENQLGRLQSSLVAASSTGKVGVEVSQPLTLGSAGAPPFANPDGATIFAGSVLANLTVSYSVRGPTSAIPIVLGGAPGSLVTAQLSNTYIPYAMIAFDEGAIAFSQAGGYPIMVDGPSITYTGTAATLWIPEFVGSIGATSGLGTVDLTFRLLSVEKFAVPGGGYTLPTSTSAEINLTIASPYAQAWSHFFTTSSSFSTLTQTCTPTVVCTGAFQVGEALGIVKLTIPMTGLHTLTVTTAEFAIGIS